MPPRGLERGQERSLARHVSIREYYARVNAEAARDLSPDREAATLLPARGSAGGLSGALGRKEPADTYAERLRAEAEQRIGELHRQLRTERQAVRELKQQTGRGRALLARAGEREARQASRARIQAARHRMERRAHAALRSIEGMEDEGEQRALLQQFAAHVDRSAAEGTLDPEAHLHFAQALSEWGAATPGMTAALDAHAKAQEQSRTREAGRGLDDDEGWGV